MIKYSQNIVVQYLSPSPASLQPSCAVSPGTVSTPHGSVHDPIPTRNEMNGRKRGKGSRLVSRLVNN